MRKQCEKGLGPDIDQACEACDKAPAILSDWFLHISGLHCLKRAGYPFAKDDLSIEEWYDLGVFSDEIEAYRMAGDNIHGK